VAGRPTITDLARRAGVSTATVDRVLNGRSKVREETARRVYEAAKDIDYHATALIGYRMQAELPRMRIGFVLHKEKQAFYQNFKSQAHIAAQNATGVRGEAIIEFASSQSPADFVDKMARLADRGVEALAATAVTDMAVTDTVQRYQEQGVPCFALLNDFAQGVRQSYIGLNNIKIGRIAAHMIATAVHQPGKVAVFVGGFRWHGHELRETGFRSYFREFAPRFTVLDTLVNLETRQLTYEATLDLLARQPDLRGIYCAGGGMEGAIAALREARQPGEVTLVVNELTPESRMALADRYVAMVIATPLEALCKDLFELARQARTHEHVVALPGQHFLKPDLYLPESV
jgi:LacI family transcriptional regulator, galactose operon repressor